MFEICCATIFLSLAMVWTRKNWPNFLLKAIFIGMGIWAILHVVGKV